MTTRDPPPSRLFFWLRQLVAAAATFLAAVSPVSAQSQDRLTVFAAASMKPALDEIVAGWNGEVAISYGGSGTLARQVAAGAPVDVVILAAADWMDWLSAQGVLEGEATSIASNRLVIVGPPGAESLPLEEGAILERLGAERLAIGEPTSVPAGRYAQEALESLGLWPALANRLLAASDVRAALAYVEGGDAPLGVVYASDAVGSSVEVVAEVPPESHAPIAYPAAITRDASPDARKFLAYIAASRDVLGRYGFAR